MSRSIHIRAFAIADYAAAHEFWSSIEGMGLNESDTPQALHADANSAAPSVRAAISQPVLVLPGGLER